MKISFIDQLVAKITYNNALVVKITLIGSRKRFLWSVCRKDYLYQLQVWWQRSLVWSVGGKGYLCCLISGI